MNEKVKQKLEDEAALKGFEDGKKGTGYDGPDSPWYRSRNETEEIQKKAYDESYKAAQDRKK